MAEGYRHGKTPESSTRALWKSYQQSYLVEKQEELEYVECNPVLYIYFQMVPGSTFGLKACYRAILTGSSQFSSIPSRKCYKLNLK
jgi:hypothetical protein